CAAADRSASLVRIADQLGDSPFGVIHRRLVLAFSIAVLWLLGGIILLCGTAQRCAHCFLFPPT
ncbi:hypothetical protein MTR67_039262, partial [Solanum verrucosum]